MAWGAEWAWWGAGVGLHPSPAGIFYKGQGAAEATKQQRAMHSSRGQWEAWAQATRQGGSPGGHLGRKKWRRHARAQLGHTFSVTPPPHTPSPTLTTTRTGDKASTYTASIITM